MKKLYFAPLEGITTNIYRSVHRSFFGECDSYFAPFITPTENEKITAKTLKDVLPENNENVPLKVQVLSNNATVFLNFCQSLKVIGYDEVNLNFGCPSGTVTSKNRGAGILKDLSLLDRFLDGVFNNTDMKISVKTRVGFESHEEFPKILEIYKKYPISELIVHPRTREEQYGGAPCEEDFLLASQSFKGPLCYNGNVFSADDFNRICEKFPEADAVMIGRGAVMNPAIFREIRGGKKLTKQELLDFSNALCEKYLSVLNSDYFTLHKLKEIWLLMVKSFPEDKKILKKIKKSAKIPELDSAISMLPEI